VVAALLAAAMVLFPTYVSARLVTVREGVPQLVEARNLCDSLPADAALLLTGSLAKTYQQTARSYCDGAPVAGLSVQPTRALLGQVQATAASHGRRLYVLVTSRDALPPDVTAASTPWQAISCVRVSHWNAVLEQAAHAWGADRRTLYLGTVTPQGTVTPTTPVKPPISAC
jgi:hypothetical protein